MDLYFVFQIAILIMSVVIHEVAHGYAAYQLGDPTAKYEGRLTLNPAKHLDFLGSFLVPAISYSLGGFIFGWAKPVPYNPYNLRPGRWSEALVAVAGPASNLILVLIFSLLIRAGAMAGWASNSFLEITAVIVFINLILAIFNLMPVPPLDGSKILFATLPERFNSIRDTLERYGLFLVVLFIFFGWRFISSVVLWFFVAIAGPQAVGYLPF